MTPTQQERRIQALYDDSNVSRRNLCERTVHLEADMEDVQAENAKLRTALIAVLQCNGITKRDKGCDACPMYDKEKEYVWAGDWCGIKRFIRELGIEVTE